MMETNSAAAEVAFVMACICGRTNSTDVAPSVTLRTTVKTVPTFSISPFWNIRKPSQKASAVPDKTRKVWVEKRTP